MRAPICEPLRVRDKESAIRISRCSKTTCLTFNPIASPLRVPQCSRKATSRQYCECGKAGDFEKVSCLRASMMAAASLSVNGLRFSMDLFRFLFATSASGFALILPLRSRYSKNLKRQLRLSLNVRFENASLLNRLGIESKSILPHLISI